MIRPPPDRRVWCPARPAHKIGPVRNTLRTLVASCTAFVMAGALLGAQWADGRGMHECWAGASKDAGAEEAMAMHHMHHQADQPGQSPGRHHESNRTCPCVLTGHTATLAWSPAAPVLVSVLSIPVGAEPRSALNSVVISASHRLPFAIGPPLLA